MNIKKLNLGCGMDYKANYINLDYNRNIKADIYHDLNKFPYPFKDNEFDEIYCHHILEHIDDVLRVTEEMWRISKPNAKIIITSPHSSSFEVNVDITHKRGLNTQSFRRCFSNNDTWSFYTNAKFNVLKDYIEFYPYMKPLEYVVNKFRAIKNIYERHFAYILQPKVINIILKVIK